MENKYLATIEIKLLYNIPINKYIKHLGIQLKKINITLSWPVNKTTKMYMLCTNICFFQYNRVVIYLLSVNVLHIITTILNFAQLTGAAK